VFTINVKILNGVPILGIASSILPFFIAQDFDEKQVSGTSVRIDI